MASQLNTERVLNCAELAEAKGYTSFALSHNGNCHSAPVKDVDYFKKGPAGKGKCIDGVGTHGNTFVYTFGKLLSTSVIQLKTKRTCLVHFSHGLFIFNFMSIG